MNTSNEWKWHRCKTISVWTNTNAHHTTIWNVGSLRCSMQSQINSGGKHHSHIPCIHGMSVQYILYHCIKSLLVCRPDPVDHKGGLFIQTSLTSTFTYRLNMALDNMNMCYNWITLYYKCFYLFYLLVLFWNLENWMVSCRNVQE